MLEIRARPLEIDAIGVELHRRDTASDPDIEPATAQVIEHAQLFQEPQRMVERQQIKQRAEADVLGRARRGGQEYAR